MLFQKKVDRALNLLKEKKGLNNGNNLDGKSDVEDEYEEKAELEKNDFAAIMIAALLVFSPILILLAIILFIVLL